MNETKRAFLSAGIVCMAAGAVVFGNSVRTNIENPHVSENLTASRLLVSAQKNDVSEVDFFHELSRLLHREYVEPITDDEKLAAGAVRGMVGSLGETHSIFMDKDQTSIYEGMMKGEYQGIGANLVFILDPNTPTGEDVSASEDDTPGVLRLPRVVVASVVPGGPADKAGIKVGDWVHSIDGHWVIDGRTISRYRELASKVADKKADQTELTKMRKLLRDMSESAIMPVKAKDQLVKGESGSIQVVMNRGTQEVPFNIVKAKSTVEPVVASGVQVSRLLFLPGAEATFKSAIQGKDSVDIDLRNNSFGDFDTMKSCLAALLPSGTYGSISTKRGGKPVPFTIAAGASKPVAVHLTIDDSTRGVAEIFAKALEAGGHATVTGADTAKDLVVTKYEALPEGSSYTLAVGQYVAKGGSK